MTPRCSCPGGESTPLRGGANLRLTAKSTLWPRFHSRCWASSNTGTNLQGSVGTGWAWEDYLHTVSSALEDRCRPGGTFLWVDEAPERLAKVHEGEIVVAPAAGRIRMKVQGGLIHHWIGAAFLPNVKIDDILDVIRDYGWYKDFYPPSVIESR